MEMPCAIWVNLYKGNTDYVCTHMYRHGQQLKHHQWEHSDKKKAKERKRRERKTHLQYLSLMPSQLNCVAIFEPKILGEVII